MRAVVEQRSSGCGGAGGCGPAAPTDVAVRFRGVLGAFPTGVALITASGAGGPVGMAVSSFMSLSLDPPLVLFCAALSSGTWPLVEATGAFAVNVLGEDAADVCLRFARRGVDRFAGSGYRLGATGAPVLSGVAAHLDCRIEAVHPGGDHAIVVGRVVHLAADDNVRPLIFHAGDYRALRP